MVELLMHVLFVEGCSQHVYCMQKNIQSDLYSKVFLACLPGALQDQVLPDEGHVQEPPPNTTPVAVRFDSQAASMFRKCEDRLRTC